MQDKLDEGIFNWFPWFGDHEMRFATWGEDCRSHPKIWGWFRKWHVKGVLPDSRSMPPTDFISWSFPAVFHVNLHYGQLHILEGNLGFREGDIGPQLSYSGVLHAFNKFVGLQPSILHFCDLLPHRCQLSLHDSGLRLNRSKTFIGKANTDSSHDEQGTCEIKVPSPALPRHRHTGAGSRNGDRHGFLCICVGWCLAGILLFLGCGGAICARRLRRGWTLMTVRVLLDAVATTSGAIGCLPWDSAAVPA